MNSADVLEELSRREKLQRLVDHIILENIKRDHRQRIKRGIVHDLVAEKLGVANSSRLRTLVNERMEALGHPRCILHGARYFWHAALKKSEATKAA